MFESHSKPKKEVESVFSLINIIFLLIVFFLVAGHVGTRHFEVSPPTVDNATPLASQDGCTLQISDNKALYKGLNVINNVNELQVISKTCNKKILLASEGTAPAVSVVSAMNKIKPYFNEIKLLVTSQK
jgi:biopolymer transport protein ExbD